MTIDPFVFVLALAAAATAGLAPTAWRWGRRARGDGPRGVLALARAHRFEAGDDALLVLDLDDRLVAANDAAVARVGDGTLRPGTSLRDLDPAWSALVRLGAVAGGDTAWTVAGRTYEGSVATLRDARARAVGRLIALRDVTDLRDSRDLVQALATRDELTGVANRGHFLAEAERRVAACERQARALSLVTLDVVGLDAVNEAFGHAVGDALLRAVAAAMVADVRASDLVGRIGGDRFALLLPDADREQAERVAERVRGAVADVAVPTAQGAVVARVRVGVADVAAGPTDRGAAGDLVRLLERARREARATPVPAASVPRAAVA